MVYWYTIKNKKTGNLQTRIGTKTQLSDDRVKGMAKHAKDYYKGRRQFIFSPIHHTSNILIMNEKSKF